MSSMNKVTHALYLWLRKHGIANDDVKLTLEFRDERSAGRGCMAIEDEWNAGSLNPGMAMPNVQRGSYTIRGIKVEFPQAQETTPYEPYRGLHEDIWGPGSPAYTTVDQHYATSPAGMSLDAIRRARDLMVANVAVANDPVQTRRVARGRPR